MSSFGGFIRKLPSYIIVILECIFFVLLFSLLQFVSVALFDHVNISFSEGQGRIACLYSILSILVFGAILLSCRSNPNSKLDFYIRKPTIKEVFMALVIGFGAVGLASVFLLICHYIGDQLSPAVKETMDQYSESMDRYAYVENSKVPFIDDILTFITTFLLVPISEELCYRAAMIGALRKKMGVFPAIIISSLLFAAGHSFPIQFIYAFASGLAFGVVYCSIKNIWVTILIHAVFNFLGGAFFTFLDSYFMESTGISKTLAEGFNDITTQVSFYLALPSIALVVQLFINLLKEVSSSKKNRNGDIVSYEEDSDSSLLPQDDI